MGYIYIIFAKLELEISAFFYAYPTLPSKHPARVLFLGHKSTERYYIHSIAGCVY